MAKEKWYAIRYKDCGAAGAIVLLSKTKVGREAKIRDLYLRARQYQVKGAFEKVFDRITLTIKVEKE